MTTLDNIPLTDARHDEIVAEARYRANVAVNVDRGCYGKPAKARSLAALAAIVAAKPWVTEYVGPDARALLSR